MDQIQKQYHVHYSPARGWARVDFRELWRYKDLIWLFVKRDFAVMYKQTHSGPPVGADQSTDVCSNVYCDVWNHCGNVDRWRSAGALLFGRYSVVGLFFGLY